MEGEGVGKARYRYVVSGGVGEGVGKAQLQVRIPSIPDKPAQSPQVRC